MGRLKITWITLLGCIIIVNGLASTGDRDSRKLFGGYKITPKFCNASITLPPDDPRSHGPTICMFNHECIQRNGEVVGACMDGFLFGTCCQLHGTVVTPLKPEGYSSSSARPAIALYYEKHGENNINDGAVKHNRPTATTKYTTKAPPTYPSSGGYYGSTGLDDRFVSNPSNSIQSVTISSNSIIDNGGPSSSYYPHPSTPSGTITQGELYLPPAADASESFSAELPALLNNYGSFDDDISIATEKNTDFTAAGISHITNTLLNDKSGVFSTTGVNYPGGSESDSVMVESNGEEINNYGQPSSTSASFSSSSAAPYDEEPTTPRIVKITYAKPQFKPKPTKATTDNPEKFILVHTISHDTETSLKPDATISDGDIESIESIILMLNNSNSAGPQYNTQTEKTGAPSSVTPSTSYGASSTYGLSSSYGSTGGTRPTGFFITTKQPSSPEAADSKPLTSYLFSTTLPSRKPDVTSSKAPQEDNYQLISSTVNSIQFPSSTLQPPSYSYSTTERPIQSSSIYISSSTNVGSSSTYGSSSSSAATTKSPPSTSYISSTTAVPRRPTKTTPVKEVIITQKTRPQTKPTKKINTKSPQTSATATKKPTTSFVTGTPTRRPVTSTSTVSPPPKSSYRPSSTAASTKIPTAAPSSTTVKNPSSPILIASYGNDFIQSATDGYQTNNRPTAAPIGQGYVTNNGFVQVSTISDRPNTIHITPKPPSGIGSIVTTSQWSRPPGVSQYTVSGAPSGSSYIYNPVSVTRPGFYSTTPQYPPISNDFDDSGYFGATVRPTVEHIVTQTSVYNVIDIDPALNSYGEQVSSTYGYPISGSTYGKPILGSTYGQPVAQSTYGDTQYSSTPSYPSSYDDGSIKDTFQTTPDQFVNFPPVRNPNLNISAITNSDDSAGAPQFAEDSVLDDKMGLLVNKIVQSLQGNFDTLADMVYDRNESMIEIEQLEDKPSQSTVPVKTTKKPVSTKRPPAKTTTQRPLTTTKRAVVTKDTTTRRPTRKPVTTLVTKKPTTVTKKPTKATRPTKKVITTTTSSPTTLSDDFEYDTVGEETETDEEEAETHYQGKLQCGVRPQVKSGRIVGGKSSAFGEWPWQVLVKESTWLGLFTKNKCGGVLITNSYVMTAAHCQPGFLASLVAVFGEYDISGELESKRSVSKNVKNVIVHRQYDAATFENDLALLQLESPIHYDAHIVPICMPLDEAEFTGRMATVTGWGRLKYGGGVPSVLQEVQVPVIENSVCQEMFNTAGHSKKILPSFLCAGYANGQKDSCEGDSGGPLVLQRADGRWELAGTVSHGIKCAAPYLPGVYMRTTFYKPWLQTVTGVH